MFYIYLLSGLLGMLILLAYILILRYIKKARLRKIERDGVVRLKYNRNKDGYAIIRIWGDDKSDVKLFSTHDFSSNEELFEYVNESLLHQMNLMLANRAKNNNPLKSKPKPKTMVSFQFAKYHYKVYLGASIIYYESFDMVSDIPDIESRASRAINKVEYTNTHRENFTEV